MAMEQGEKRAIHPFFRKDVGIPPQPPSQSITVANGIPPSNPSRDGVPIVGHHDTTNGQFTEGQGFQPPQNPRPSYILTLPVALLEPDPNSSRRKRRRTDQHEPNGIADIPSDEISAGEERRAPTGPIEIHHHVESTPIAVNNVPTPEIATPAPNLAAISGTTDAMNETTGDSTAPEKRYPERQRTLRLNPNGKLLSSPVGKQSEETDLKKKDNKGGKKGGRKSKKDGNKLVVMKYANDETSRERIGKIIDDIVNGRTRFSPQRFAPCSQPASGPGSVSTTPAPRVVANQPPKSTHPFFLKKPVRKADISCSAQAHPQDSAATNTPAEDTRKPPSLIREGSNMSSFGTARPVMSSFKPRSKFPEPIYPLWPPQDFVHVRDAKKPPSLHHKDSSRALNADQKKAKDAVVRVPDDENVLLSGTYGQSRNKHIPESLRIPGRHVASGQTLQKAMARQLSGYFWTQDPAKLTQNNDMHPAVARLNSTLTTSMTAFDRGQCDTLPWVQKYAPNCAEEVLQTGREAHMLRDWMRFLVISAVDTGKSSKDSEKTKQKAEEKKLAKKRKKSEKLDGFIVSSEDEASEMGELSHSEEDELAGGVTVSSRKTVVRSGDLVASSKSAARMSNAILLSGPSGCGKTASIYAVAKELDFEVFEINPGNRRNGRDVLERVGDMTRNHLVNKLNMSEGASNQSSRAASPQEVEPEERKQNKLMSFFKPQPTSTSAKGTKPSRKETEKETDAKSSRPQKQSLILLEEADILFEEDRQFWSGVMSLIQQSRRPIIITCNDENLIPLQDLSLHAILRYRPPPHELAVDYLLLVAANEGHLLQRPAINDLYIAARSDLRRSIMDLNFWCQMAIGSKKSGLDWMVDRWPPGRDLDQNRDPLRVLSLNTYQQFMGWFSRDMLLDDTLESEVESQQESLNWWQLGIQDSETMAFSSSRAMSESYLPESKHEQLKNLRYESEYADMRSVLDTLCTGCPVDPKLDAVDPSVPPMPEKYRANYIEGHPLLHADLKTEYSSLAAAIGSTSEALIGKVFRPRSKVNVEHSKAMQVLANTWNIRTISAPDKQLATAFQPMIRGDDPFYGSGRPAQSFNNGSGPLWEDLAPYIRAIVAFDLRLEQYRLNLSGLLSPGAGSKRKMRKTRASRAALEGGDKANTRKERWFPPDTNPSRILATGNKEWQDLLVQSGHFAIGLVPEPGNGPSTEPGRESSEDEAAASESSSDELAGK